MSGGSEANFELGYAVNVDSHVALLKATHAHAKATGQEGATKPVYVFVSSLAIYGGPKCRPQDFVVPDETPLLPGTSYGVEKNIIELYAYDYGRKGGSNNSDRADQQATSTPVPSDCRRS
jgi:nucleoside-diphosphate-sugar epimerase